MVARVTVTLPEDVLDRLDEAAEADGVTRSDVVREAAVGYLTGRAADERARARHDAVEDGLAWLAGVARRHEGDGASSLVTLRELRGASDAAPIEPDADRR